MARQGRRRSRSGSRDTLHRRRRGYGFWPSSPSRPPGLFLKRLEEAKRYVFVDERKVENDGGNGEEVGGSNGLLKVQEEVDGVGLECETVGPVPLSVASTRQTISGDKYGVQLLPGEGLAMAAFASSGKRIPRRGEIGLNSDEIDRFEKIGFVMSGSRHHAMNAIRQKKETAVLSVEEQRRYAKEQVEERVRRENVVVSQFKEFVQDQVRRLGKERR